MHAELTLPLATLWSFLLVLARVSGVLVFVPLPGLRTGPEPARVVLALGFAAALWPHWPQAHAALPGLGTLAVWLAAEAAWGITVGVTVAFLTEGFLVACQIVGLQAGYSYASTIDPATQADSNVLLVFAQLMAGLLFFSLGMDRQIVRVFARSLETIPPGAFLLPLGSARQVMALGADMFTAGLRLAMPVLALLAVVDISLALLGRLHAQLQLLMLAFPAKMLAGLALLATVAAAFVPIFRAASEHTLAVLFRLAGTAP